MIGEVFGKLKILDGPYCSEADPSWYCECSCGTLTLIKQRRFVNNKRRTCGCAGRKDLFTHNRYYEAEHLAWRNMIKRCSDERFSQWYGTITVCDRWSNSYEDFLSDVGRRPTSRHSLDRIDPSGHYEPGNVRWADKATQSRNTKNHITNKTGIRGVSWSAAKQKWRAAIYVNNTQKHLGYFDDIEAAKKARSQGEVEFWGTQPT